MTNGQLWDRDSSGVLGLCNDDEGFAGPLASGDFNGDDKADLSVGSIGLDESINILYGAP